MKQSVVDRAFYILFFVTFLFGMVFNSSIELFTGFKGSDELCALGLILLFLYQVFQSETWAFNKAFLVTLLIFFCYVAYSFSIHSNTTVAIIRDMVIQMKPYLAFFCAYQLAPRFTDSNKKILRDSSLVVWVLLLPLGMLELIDVYNLQTYMGHQTYFAGAVMALSSVYLMCGNYTKKERLIFIGMLSLGLCSTRSKYYGFFVFACFAVSLLDNVKYIKFSFKNVMIGLLIVGAVIFVAKDKIIFYFMQDITNTSRADTELIARAVLYAGSIPIFMDYFPFGSGLGTYATYTSGEYYSPVYAEYGLDKVWGISETYKSFIADTYYPSLAQFGVVGVLLFLLFWVYIFRKSYTHFKIQQNPHYFVLVLIIIGYAFIENIAEAMFTSYKGYFMLMLLGILCAWQRREVETILLSEDNAARSRTE